MGIKNIAAGMLSIALCFAMTSCKPKTEPMPMDFSSLLADGALTVEIDKSITIELPPPVEKAVATVGDVSAGIEAVYAAADPKADGSVPTLTVNGLAVGSQNATVTFTAKGYEDAPLALAITVTEPPPPPPPPQPQLAVALSSELLGINAGISSSDSALSFKMESGIGADIVVHAKDSVISVDAKCDNPNIEVVTVGNIITLRPKEAGNSILTITASTVGHTDAVAQCSVEIKPPHAKPILVADTDTATKVSHG